MKASILLLLLVAIASARYSRRYANVINSLKNEQREQVDAIVKKEEGKPLSKALVQAAPGERSYASYFNRMMSEDVRGHHKLDDPFKVESLYSKPIKHGNRPLSRDHVSDYLNAKYYGPQGYQYKHTRDIKNGNTRSYSKRVVMQYNSNGRSPMPEGMKAFWKNADGDMWF